jgi:hypothetical protein
VAPSQAECHAPTCGHAVTETSGPEDHLPCTPPAPTHHPHLLQLALASELYVVLGHPRARPLQPMWHALDSHLIGTNARSNDPAFAQRLREANPRHAMPRKASPSSQSRCRRWPTFLRSSCCVCVLLA